MNLIYNKHIQFSFDINQLPESKTIIINESKTPLAIAHAGSFRRLFLHFQLYELLCNKGFDVKFIFGNDDYDPLDYLPGYFSDEQNEFYKNYLGHPLSNIPSQVSNVSYADFHFEKITNVLEHSFNIVPDVYKTSDLYKQGFFNDGIKLVLNNLKKITSLYENVTGTADKFDERPIQVICPHCGNMRTTKVLEYREDEVLVSCEDAVIREISLTGCGFNEWISPFDGNSRLCWKLEWPVRWFYLNIDVEGGRKDQNSSLGARQFAELLYKLLFDKKPPVNLPYDFCYVRSVHSSQVNRFGVSIFEALKFMPPQMFFNLVTKEKNTRPYDLDLESEKMFKLYEEYYQNEVRHISHYDFDSILHHARFFSEDESDLSTEQKSFILCLRHFLETSSSDGAWLIVNDVNKVDIKYHTLVNSLVANFKKVQHWNAQIIQDLFRETCIESNVPFSEACLMVYEMLIKRRTGPRIGILFENIGQQKTVNLLVSAV